MATKKRSRTDDGDPEEDDLEEEDDDEETEVQSEDDGDEEEEDGEDEGDGKTKSKAKETNEERLAREMRELKKELRTIRRQKTEAENKLTKAGITSKDDPEDLKARAERAETALRERMAHDRQIQAREAVREVIEGEEQYAPYRKQVRYIMTDLHELLSDEDIDPDTGEYDADALSDYAAKAVARFAKSAPVSVKEQGGSRTGSGGPGGVPARGGAKGGAPNKRDEMNRKYNGILDRVGVVPR